MDSPHNRIWDERLRLARLDREDFVRIGLLSALLALGFAIFHFMGNTSDAERWGRSALSWMVVRWGDSGISMGGGDYSHGFLVPIASAYILWMNKEDIITAPKRVSTIGLALVVVFLIGHYLGVKAQQTRLSLLALIGLLWSIPLYLYGWQVARRLLFPCGFLIFAVPLNFLDSLTFPLRMINTKSAVFFLNGLGVPVKQIGSGIFWPPYDQTSPMKLDVADPCSGIRSLTAMMALTAIYGYLVMKGFWRKWLLFLASIPLAMIGNMARITGISVMAEAFGAEFATGLMHDYSGYIVFGIAIGLMVGLSFLLNLDPKETAIQWKKKLGSVSI
jgi:exosortase